MCVRVSLTRVVDDCTVRGILQQAYMGSPCMTFARAASKSEMRQGVGKGNLRRMFQPLPTAGHGVHRSRLSNKTLKTKTRRAQGEAGRGKATAAYLLPIALWDLRWVSFPQFAEMEKHATCHPPVAPQESCEGKKRPPGREDPKFSLAAVEEARTRN